MAHSRFPSGQDTPAFKNTWVKEAAQPAASGSGTQNIGGVGWPHVLPTGGGSRRHPTLALHLVLPYDGPQQRPPAIGANPMAYECSRDLREKHSDTRSRVPRPERWARWDSCPLRSIVRCKGLWRTWKCLEPLRTEIDACFGFVSLSR